MTDSDLAKLSVEFRRTIAEINFRLDLIEARQRARAELLDLFADMPSEELAYHVALIRQQRPKQTAREIAASRWSRQTRKIP